MARARYRRCARRRGGKRVRGARRGARRPRRLRNQSAAGLEVELEFGVVRLLFGLLMGYRWLRKKSCGIYRISVEGGGPNPEILYLPEVFSQTN
jgi:hypothetical protein